MYNVCVAWHKHKHMRYCVTLLSTDKALHTVWWLFQLVQPNTEIKLFSWFTELKVCNTDLRSWNNSEGGGVGVVFHTVPDWILEHWFFGTLFKTCDPPIRLLDIPRYKPPLSYSHQSTVYMSHNWCPRVWYVRYLSNIIDQALASWALVPMWFNDSI